MQINIKDMLFQCHSESLNFTQLKKQHCRLWCS